ncbi:MAG: 30S ribosomal protein S8 [Bacteroidia bacterium]|nr:30S ribosomal protein S8 [Bacteroidia bacterium]MDW8159377.1 30S ribosomal protein S8 [Bacteroidia bacterium]
MHTDPIADYLTRIRNALKARHRVVTMPSSKMKLGITRVLRDAGYIANFKEVEGKSYKILKIALKYDPETKQPAITQLVRVSKPGLRRYTSCESIPRVMNGLGIAILSTSQGIMTGREAQRNNVGGEILCYVY